MIGRKNHEEWALRLFDKSVLKQRKFQEITALLGPTGGLNCLDLGSDNGVISLLLRRGGGAWASADLEEKTVAAIRSLVRSNVFQIEGEKLPFETETFDRVVVVDLLEHVRDDRAFVLELARVLRPGGSVILNVPHLKPGLLRRFRQLLGQTDEQHGHLRPGYTPAGLQQLLGEHFTLKSRKTYSRFFSELIDTLIVFAAGRLQQRKGASRKGLVVTGQDLDANQGLFRAYSLLYPLVWLVSRLDGLLFFTSGYMLIARAEINKRPAAQRGNGHNALEAAALPAGRIS